MPTIRAGSIDIHYREAGSGRPLVLLHGGLVSSSPIWEGVPVAYASWLEPLGERFHVIAPDTRGCGRTANSGGEFTFATLADDVAALSDALGLERPLLTGFSEGGLTALIAAIRHPDTFAAVASDAGYDMLNPHAPTFAMMRRMLGGRPDATVADPDAAAEFFGQAEPMRSMFALMQADQDAGQGDGHWREYLRRAFERTTTALGFTYHDLQRITVPTLILTGDRDDFCTVAEAATALAALPDGELAIFPATPHVITAAKIATTLEFFERRASPAPSSQAFAHA
jgi:pimeloyl-ACP methyl ester carboxylesterase